MKVKTRPFSLVFSDAFPGLDLDVAGHRGLVEAEDVRAVGDGAVQEDQREEPADGEEAPAGQAGAARFAAVAQEALLPAAGLGLERPSKLIIDEYHRFRDIFKTCSSLFEENFDRNWPFEEVFTCFQPSKGTTGPWVEGAAAAVAAWDLSLATGVPTTKGGCVVSTFTASPTTGMADLFQTV